MSTPAERLARLQALRDAGRKIVMVTAYDVASARACEAAGVDVVLVGDSGANTVLGYATTREVSLDEMLMLTRAARRGCETPLFVGDLPFGTYERSNEQALATASRFVDAGCDAVKLEGGGEMVDRALSLVASGIPVMGHVGLLPQGATRPEELRARGRTRDEAIGIARDSLALQAAGCCAIVFEAIPATLTELIMPRMRIPVIGIGAGAATDGQVLVYHDLLGITPGEHPPRFVKRYEEIGAAMRRGVEGFAAEVRDGWYPQPQHTYGMDAAVLAEVRRALEG